MFNQVDFDKAERQWESQHELPAEPKEEPEHDKDYWRYDE